VILKSQTVLTLAALFAIGSTPLAAQGGHEDNLMPIVENPDKEKFAHGELAQINVAYVSRVKPILAKGCGDCHTGQTVYPWYYVLPGIKQLIDHDVEEAKEHLDMSQDFPFEGHGDAVDDLKALRRTIKENSMPPISYRWMHQDVALSEAEKRIVVEWVEESLQTIRHNKK
jgi:hypothetical protein